MARIDRLERDQLTKASAHTDAECTYDIVVDESGDRCLQLDTYGSKARKLKGKKSQSIRLTPRAIAQLKQIFMEHGL